MKVQHQHRLWIAGAWSESSKTREIAAPADQTKIAQVFEATSEQMLLALEAARQAFVLYRKTSRYARSSLLLAIAEGIAERRSEFVETMAMEAGKPVNTAELEVNRAITTFTVAAEEAKRFAGEVVPIDIESSGRAYSPAISYRVPRGVVLGITPFNFPLNLVAHKVAPALAVGASILVKPAPQAPGCAVILAEIFERAVKKISDDRDTVPLATLQVVSCSNDVAALAVKDPRIATLSFTGSSAVGWALQAQAVRKKVVLELGGNAAVIVHEDANLLRAAQRCVWGGFSYAGQSCISVQRIFVHKKIAGKFQDLVLAETEKVITGDPLKKETVVGPVIDSKAAERIMAWIEEAKSSGAKILTGGTRQQNTIAPTVVASVPHGMKLVSEEVFGPVILLDTYEDFSEVIAAVNESRYGLQAGLFTDHASLVRQAIETLEVGGVIINDVPTFRADNMPYGGVKESGLGREGVRYVMDDFSETRTLVQWTG